MKCRFRPGWAAYSIVPILLTFLFFLTSEPALASGADGYGNWIDWTWWCGEGAYVRILANHKANAHVEYYYTGSYTVVYWQDFGGSIYPKSSPCGYHDWIKRDTYYETYYGTVNISGWFEVPTWCDPANNVALTTAIRTITFTALLVPAGSRAAHGSPISAFRIWVRSIPPLSTSRRAMPVCCI